MYRSGYFEESMKTKRVFFFLHYQSHYVLKSPLSLFKFSFFLVNLFQSFRPIYHFFKELPALLVRLPPMAHYKYANTAIEIQMSRQHHPDNFNPAGNKTSVFVLIIEQQPTEPFCPNRSFSNCLFSICILILPAKNNN